jgi:serine/threonine protein kinase
MQNTKAELSKFRHSFGRYLLKGESKMSLSEFYVANGTHADLWRGVIEDKVVAVKVWRAVSLSTSARNDFETLLLQQLPEWDRCKHPNIVPFLGVVPKLGRLPSVVMPYFNNGTVNDYLVDNPMTDRLHLVRGVANALIFMHGLTPPIVHGDIKGANVLVNDIGEACLSDIGVSKMPFPLDWTQPFGTRSARWMAPELIAPNDEGEDDYPVTCQTDVYSFSMTVIEILTCRLPFSHRRHDSMVVHDVFHGRRPIRPSNPEVTDPMWELIQSCWHQDPSKRSTMAIVGFWLALLAEPRTFESEAT